MLKMKWKTLFVLVVSLALGGVLISSFVFKKQHPIKLSFFNFDAYASEAGEEHLSEIYSYQKTETTENFKDLLNANKVAGGITSAYAIAQFAREGLIKKIDYSKFFGTGKTEDYNEAWIKKTYTPLVFQQMQVYDQYLNFGRDTNDHLWEYTIPYFTQEKIVAYDWNDVDKSKLTSEEKEKEEITFSENDRKSFATIFKKIRSKFKGTKRIVIHDEIRDNIAYGSVLDEANKKNFDGNLDPKKVSQYIDNFINDVTENNTYQLGDISRLSFTDNSNDVLSDLINPQKNIGAGILYNGDAVDAFFSIDNFDYYSTPREGVDPYPVRIVRPQAQITLLDGLVIASQTSEEESNKMLNEVYESLYKGIYQEDYQEEATLEDLYKTPGFDNFDYVRYTGVTNFFVNMITYGNVDPNKAVPKEETLVYEDFIVDETPEGEPIFYEGLNEEDIFKKIAIVENMYDVEVIKNPSFIAPSSDVALAFAQIEYTKKLKN